MINSNQMDTCNHGAHCCGVKCISWSAIFVGAFVGMGIVFLLNIFSVAIGLTVLPTSASGTISFAIGGFVGAIIGAFISMFVAGWVAGYLGRPYCFKRNLGVLYGFTTWCVALILTMLLAAYVGRYLTSYVNFISNPGTIVLTNTEPVAIAVPTMKSNILITISANNLAWNVLIVFILFFIGALGACFGGYYGMTCRCKSERGCDCCPPKTA